MRTFLLLLSGGVLTSLAEFFLKYNLIDLLKDKVVALYRKLTGKAKAAEAKIQAEVKAEIAQFKPKPKGK